MSGGLDAWVSSGARRFPTRRALVDENGCGLTYRSLEDGVERSAQAVAALDLPWGSRLAVFSRNSFESVAAYFACLRTGGVVVWLNHSLSNAELREIVKDSEASLLVYETEFGERAKMISAFEGGPRTLPLGELLNFKPRRSVAFGDEVRPETLASIVYTSGSTDKPLGVMLTHRNFISNNEAIRDYLELSEKDVVCCVLPFYYIYGLSLLFSHVAAGGAVFIENRFAFPQVAAQSLEEAGATGFSGVSSHYLILMDRTDFLSREYKALRYFTHAGDKMPVSATERVLRAFPRKKFFLMYGQTEASPRISYLDPGSTAKKPSSAGKPLRGVELRILDDHDRDRPPREEGEIVIRGDNVMRGYWKRPEETDRVLRDGYLYTGDLGYKDEEGDLFVTGRIKQFIKVGGRRVSPSEVESMALEFPGVREAAALGAPDGTLGEKILLYVTLKDNGTADVDALKSFYKTKAPFYKVPSEVFVVSTIPRNSQGKIDRWRLAGTRG